MRTRFYLVRHGETEWNQKGIYQGWTDIPLSKEGELQTKCLGKRFENTALKLDAVYCSPLQRAIQTAKAMADAKGLPVITDVHFKEINFGEWEGYTEKITQTFMNILLHIHFLARAIFNLLWNVPQRDFMNF